MSGNPPTQKKGLRIAGGPSCDRTRGTSNLFLNHVICIPAPICRFYILRHHLGVCQMAMGQNPNRTPPVNIPIPTKIGSKMGGEFTYQPKWNFIGVDPRPGHHDSLFDLCHTTASQSRRPHRAFSPAWKTWACEPFVGSKEKTESWHRPISRNQTLAPTRARSSLDVSL